MYTRRHAAPNTASSCSALAESEHAVDILDAYVATYVREEILQDTLIGVWLPAWRRRAKVKEVASPKFYLFDAGVARALAGRLREPLDGLERGFLLETWMLHELRAALASLCQEQRHCLENSNEGCPPISNEFVL